jgi:SAM-dependent methyltransferase
LNPTQSAEQSEPTFWARAQPGFRFTERPVGTPAFFREIEQHRYALEPHIPEIVQFGHWRDHDVLELGCGIATDGLQFARAGARYTGLDSSPSAIDLARRRFAMEDRRAEFVEASATGLPFDDRTFDLVYANGVLHHIPDVERAVEEAHRVLRPGGHLVAMVYHRRSFNYYVAVLGLRRSLAWALLIPGMPEVAAKLAGERLEVLEGHRKLLQTMGIRYLTERQTFLSNNTDGPGNPLSRVYSRHEAAKLFERFSDVEMTVRHMNMRAFPGGSRLGRTQLAKRLGARFGWHLFVHGRKR